MMTRTSFANPFLFSACPVLHCKKKQKLVFPSHFAQTKSEKKKHQEDDSDWLLSMFRAQERIAPPTTFALICDVALPVPAPYE